MISEKYRKLNEEMHKKYKTYGSSAAKWAPYIGYMRGSTILDYGCGKGKLAKACDFPVDEYDPAIPGKNSPPSVHDCLVCTDVLEHIEPEHLQATLVHMRRLMRDAGFLVVSTKPAKKFLPDGRNAHLIVQPKEWWKEKLSEHFVIKDMQDGIFNEEEVIFIVEKK